jgi:tetratricopeptide (TPR) repeat protein
MAYAFTTPPAANRELTATSQVAAGHALAPASDLVQPARNRRTEPTAMNHRIQLLRVLAALMMSIVPLLATAAEPAATIAPAPTATIVPADSAAWTDPDVSSRPLSASRGNLAQRLARAERRLETAPDDIAARAERAWVLAQQGPAQREAALADLDAALAASIKASRELHRAVLWGAGWTAIGFGDGELALRFWDANLRQTDSQPFWVPYSRAVAYAASGDLDAAVGWYAVAARDWPQRFANSKGLAVYTRHWQPRERALIESVYVEWAARNAPAPVAAD